MLIRIYFYNEKLHLIDNSFLHKLEKIYSFTILMKNDYKKSIYTYVSFRLTTIIMSKDADEKQFIILLHELREITLDVKTILRIFLLMYNMSQFHFSIKCKVSF